MRFLTGGESHGPVLTAILEGLPAGLPIDRAQIDSDLSRRQSGYGRGDRMKIESDRVEIVGGVIHRMTTGAPLVLQIANRDWVHWKERWETGDLPRLTVPRPGHADYAGMTKYGLCDARPVAERASARETAARVAVGAVCKQLLQLFGVRVGSDVLQIGSVRTPRPDAEWGAAWGSAEASSVRCHDSVTAQRMEEAIDEAREKGDSLGGVFVVAACGVPIGLGSHVHWERRLDGRLAQAVMSIPAVKGVEIGAGFESARHVGTEVHDGFAIDAAGDVARTSNQAGGVEGGMSNGDPIELYAAMKPIPTTITPQDSVDLATHVAAKTTYLRSDVCAVPACAVVGEAMVAWVLAEQLQRKMGGDSLAEMESHAKGWMPDD